MYFPDPNYSILRPFSNLSDLYIWNYYFGEELKHGPSYDYEIVTQGIFIVLLINSCQNSVKLIYDLFSRVFFVCCFVFCLKTYLFFKDQEQEEDFATSAENSMTNHSNRENLVSGYDCTSRNDLNACAELLAEITQLEHELGHLPKGWQHHWQGILKYYPNIYSDIP